MYFFAFGYGIEHVPGALNATVDIITGWMRGCLRSLSFAPRFARIEQVATGKLVPTVLVEERCSPNSDNICAAQSMAAKNTHSVTFYEEGMVRLNDEFSIPNDNDEVKLKFLAIAHVGKAEHRGGEATAASFKEAFL